MAIIPNAVPEEALDYGEIMRRGGANLGDENFALCKCPHCNRVYLVEYEIDTLYLDPEDLSRRASLTSNDPGVTCEGCQTTLPDDQPWIGPKAAESMQVTWSDLAASRWRWVTQRTRE